MCSWTKGNDPMERENSMKGGMKEMQEQSPQKGLKRGSRAQKQGFASQIMAAPHAPRFVARISDHIWNICQQSFPRKDGDPSLFSFRVLKLSPISGTQ